MDLHLSRRFETGGWLCRFHSQLKSVLPMDSIANRLSKCKRLVLSLSYPRPQCRPSSQLESTRGNLCVWSWCSLILSGRCSKDDREAASWGSVESTAIRINSWRYSGPMQVQLVLSHLSSSHCRQSKLEFPVKHREEQ